MCKSYLLLVMLISLVSSCIFKKDEVEEVTVKIPEEASSYFWSSVGSEYVYQDSVSGDLDSTQVLSSVCRINSDQKYVDYNYELCGNYVSRSLISKDEHWQLVSDYYVEEGVVYGLIQGSLVFVYGNGITEGDTISILSQDLLYVKSYDKVEVKGVIYDDVLKFEKVNTPDKSNNIDSLKYASAHYFAKGIGLIKVEHEDGSVLELIDYHIN